jgi:hypothetical protein
MQAYQSRTRAAYLHAWLWFVGSQLWGGAFIVTNIYAYAVH